MPEEPSAQSQDTFLMKKTLSAQQLDSDLANQSPWSCSKLLGFCHNSVEHAMTALSLEMILVTIHRWHCDCNTMLQGTTVGRRRTAAQPPALIAGRQYSAYKHCQHCCGLGV